MKFKAAQIAELINGLLEGDNDALITGFSGIEDATEGDITFVSDEKYAEYLASTKAGVVIVPSTLDISKHKSNGSTFIKCENPRMALAQLLTHYKSITENKVGVSSQASVSSSSAVGKDCYVGHFAILSEGSIIGDKSQIGEHCHVGKNVRIGKNCILHSGVRVLENCILGDNVTIQANSVIGGDGFGFVPNSENNYFKIPHVGNVIIEEHVEIGAGTCIDRATMGSTIIRKGAKIDNLIQIAHNVEIGENTVIAAQTGIAGSTKIGKNCMIGGQVGIVGHLEIADEVKIAAQSGVGHNIKEKGLIVQGSPAYPIREYKMSYVGFKKLPEIMKQISRLEKQLTDLNQKDK